MHFWHCFLCEALHPAIKSGQKHFLRRQHSHPAYLLEQQECTYDALNSQLTRLWNRAINSQDCKPVLFFIFLNKHSFFVSLCRSNVARDCEQSEVDQATLSLLLWFWSGSVADGGWGGDVRNLPVLQLSR